MRFAQQNAAAITIVGIGTQDDFAFAKRAVRKYKTTFQMLWDQSFVSWRRLEITDQPIFILTTPEGKEIKRWRRQFPEAEILAAARAAG